MAKNSQPCVAIVLRRQDWRETSRIVTLLTREHGRASFLAKGAHRPKSPFLGALDLLHVIEARVRVRSGRGLQYLDAAKVLQGNRAFRRDRERYGLAMQLSEIMTLTMPEGRADPELFDLYRGGLALYRGAPRNTLATIATSLELRILQQLGLLPALDRCTRTGLALPEQGRIGFSAEDGGFVAKTQGLRSVDASLPAFAIELAQVKGRQLAERHDPPAKTKALFACIHELLWWHLGETPRASFPETVLGPPAP